MRSALAVAVRRKVSTTLIYAFLLAVAAITLVPLVYALFASFKPLDEILRSGARLLPQDWTIDNYTRAWELSGFEQYLQNSAFVAAGVVSFDLIASSMLGYLLARRMLPFQRVIQAVMATTLFIGLGTATLYPRFVIADALGIANLVGVILVELSGMTVVHAFLIWAFCRSLPIELEHAARIDGCGLLRTYWLIAFPLMRPILTTTVILAFQAAWNAFQVPYVFTLANPDLRTLVVGVFALRTTGEEGVLAYDLMLAGAMLVIVPIVVLFVLLQRHFMRGLTDGGFKG